MQNEPRQHENAYSSEDMGLPNNFPSNLDWNIRNNSDNLMMMLEMKHFHDEDATTQVKRFHGEEMTMHFLVNYMTTL